MPDEAPARVAIQAMDVVDYARLIQADRVGTLARINTYRRVLIDPQIVGTGGRLVGTVGHTWIAEFPDAARAVRCATQVQADIAKRNHTVPADSRIAFRVGVSVGAMRVAGDKISGEGVTSAAAMLPSSRPGDVRMSASAMAEALRDRSLGLERLADAGPTEPDGSFRISIRQPNTDEGAPTFAAPTSGVSKRAASKGRPAPTPPGRRPSWAAKDKRNTPARPAPAPAHAEIDRAATSDQSAGGVTMTAEEHQSPPYGRWALGLGVVVIAVVVGITQFGDGPSSSDVLSDSLGAAQRANAEAARAASAQRPVVVVKAIADDADGGAEVDGGKASMDDVLSALAYLSEESRPGAGTEATALMEPLLDVPEQELARALDIYVSILKDTGRADEVLVIERRVRALRERNNAAEPSP